MPVIGMIHSDTPFLFGEYEHPQKCRIALRGHCFTFDVRDCVESLSNFYDEIEQS